MGKCKQIGGILVQLNSVEKLKSNIPLSEVISEPIANITEDVENEFTVNIITYIPNPLLEEKSIDSAIEIEKNIWLQYNGLLNISTWITTDRSSGVVYCRDFEIVYNSDNKLDSYDLYRISFNYSLKNPDDSVSAEAIYIRDKNIDPRTSRGTVTTVRKEKG